MSGNETKIGRTTSLQNAASCTGDIVLKVTLNNYRRCRTNRWTGATGSDFRIKRIRLSCSVAPWPGQLNVGRHEHRMKKLPTDRQILRSIFDSYESDYPGLKGANGRGANDPYMPIDLTKIADSLNSTPELVFGRLYYHLDPKYRFTQDDGTKVDLFFLNFQNKGPAVRFPLLASILAGLEEDHRKLVWSM